MYLCPLEDVIGNSPVWSEYDLHMVSIDSTVHIMSSIFILPGSWLGTKSLFTLVVWVGRKFFGSWSRCPYTVAVILGRCLRMSFAVMAGHDDR